MYSRDGECEGLKEYYYSIKKYSFRHIGYDSVMIVSQVTKPKISLWLLLPSEMTSSFLQQRSCCNLCSQTLLGALGLQV